MGNVSQELSEVFMEGRRCCSCTCDSPFPIMSNRNYLPVSKCRCDCSRYYERVARCQCHQCYCRCHQHERQGGFPCSTEKYSVLEDWFKRFDFDGDGRLGRDELRCLLNKLGAPMREAYIENLIHMADRDGDGKLSFSEFLLMWRQAALKDESPYPGYRCEELSAIIRYYHLYPDILYYDGHCEGRVGPTPKLLREHWCGGFPDTDRPEIPRKSIFPRIDHTSMSIGPFEQPTDIEPFQYPVFSCNRRDYVE